MNLVYFLLSSLFVALLPGPAMALVIQASIDKGLKKGLAVTLGILLADALLLILVCLGLAELLTASETIVIWMNIITSAYLIYLGGKTLYQIRFIKSEDATHIKDLTWKNGFFITLANPKTIIFLLAYFPQFIVHDSSLSESFQLMILSVLFVISVAIVMFAYVLLATSARNQLMKKQVKIIMNAIFGSLLVGLGVHNLLQLRLNK